MSAEIYPTSMLPLTPVGQFRVPKEFHNTICAYFAGPVGENASAMGIVARTGKPPSQTIVNAWKLGRIRFRLRRGRDLDLVFYSGGKGGLNFSIGADFHTASRPGEDGGYSLYFTLDRAREVAGIALPPPYPPPIFTDENIRSFRVSTARGNLGEAPIHNHRIRDSDLMTVLRWLEGRPEVVQVPWNQAHRLGTLNITLKDGRTVTVGYYDAPNGELRFSVDKIHYRLNNRYASSHNLDSDIHFVIMNEKEEGGRGH